MNYTKNKLPLFLCIALLALSLFSCTEEQVRFEPIQSGAERQEEPARESEAEKQKEPSAELSCVEPCTMPSLLAAKDGNLLVCWSDYDAEITYLRIVDIDADSVIKSLDIDGCVDLFPESFNDKGFILRDGVHERWISLDSELNISAEFPAWDMNGFFSHDRSRFYFLKNGAIYYADTAEGSVHPLGLPMNLRFNQIAAFHAKEDIIALHVYTSPFSTECGTAILDLNSGEFSMVQNRIYQPSFGKEFIKLMHFDEQAMQYELTYCGGESALYIPAARFLNMDELASVNGADYIVGVGEATELYRLSDGFASCSLEQYGITGEFRNACWLEEGGLLVGSVWKDSATKLYALRTELLDFSGNEAAQSIETPMAVDIDISRNYWGKLSGNSLPESMQGLRELADRIEEEYGVQILLSSQSEELASYCNFELILPTNMSKADELARTGYFLGSLEKSLSMYPEGFFEQFRSEAKDGGLCFFPVEQIISDIGAIGVCYEGAGWQAIAMDIRTEDMIGYICHEIWHATENKIISDNYSSFVEDVWMRFNPEGFYYNDAMEKPDPVPFRWTLFDEENGAYFIDDYARTNSKEDRARLMEYAIARPDFHERIKACPALMAKLKYMCEAVNMYFDTTGWPKTPWESFIE